MIASINMIQLKPQHSWGQPTLLHLTLAAPNFYILAIRHRWFYLVIALIMYLLISLGYHDLTNEKLSSYLCKSMATTHFENTTDNENLKSQQVMFTHVPAWYSLLSLQLVEGNPHIHNKSMPDQFQFLISTMCLTSHPAPLYFLHDLFDVP